MERRWAAPVHWRGRASSCLREANLDGLMLDFYLIVSDYPAAYGRSWLARANALVPPNVFPFEHGGLIAKYAVLSEADFARLNSPAADNVSVWARFAQPSRLLWASDDLARQRAYAACLLYTSPSPRDRQKSRMPSSA